MACDCLDKLEKLCQEKYEDPDGYVDATVPFSGPSEVISRFYYHKKRGAGRESKERSVPIIATYCPMCGKKYSEGASHD